MSNRPPISTDLYIMSLKLPSHRKKKSAHGQRSLFYQKSPSSHLIFFLFTNCLVSSMCQESGGGGLHVTGKRRRFLTELSHVMYDKEVCFHLTTFMCMYILFSGPTKVNQSGLQSSQCGQCYRYNILNSLDRAVFT